MKQRLPVIAAALSCVLTLACLVQIAALNDRIGQLQTSLSNQIHRAESSMWELSSTVSSQLEQQASLLASSGFEYGELEVENGVARLFCTVTPKQLTPGVTTATLLWGDGVETAMTLEGQRFTAWLELPLFEETPITAVTFTEDGALRIEALDQYFSPRGALLPMVYARFMDGSASGGNSYRREGNVGIDANCPQSTVELRSVELVGLLDGAEIIRKTVAPEPFGDPLDPNQYSGYFYVDETVSVPNGSTLALYTEVTDQNGLRYRNIIDRWTVDQNGQGFPDDNEWMWYGAEPEIYDEKGTLLYAPELPR